jgi:protein involved in polysaccharide export with SLBB domain
MAPALPPSGAQSIPAEETQVIDAFREFADPLSQLTRNVTASVPANYLLAPGDIVTIRYNSPTLPSREFNQTVDSQGFITVGDAGRLNVAGQTLGEAERVITQRLRLLYRGVQVQATLSQLRTIGVTVTGEAFSPGTYTVPSVATAFNLLYAAGGPTEDGTLRRIEVRRAGRLIRTLDFYDFLVGGGRTGDLPLQSGDVINIPGRLSRITVDGEVRRPAIFELTERESLRDALRFAGGVKPSGVDQRVQVSTVEPGAARVLHDIDLRNTTEVGRQPIYDGAVVEVFSVRALLANQVSVEGAVDQPGDYGLTPGMRVADLVRRARGTINEAFTTRADLYRWQPDNTLQLVRVDLEKALSGDPASNVPLQRWDRLHIFTLDEVEWTGRREVTVRGAVQRPGVYDRTADMRVRDLLLVAGGPTREAYLDRAYLLHQRPDTTFAYEQINVSAAMKGDPKYDVQIEDNDVLALYRSDEAVFQPEHVAAVRGDVVSPGVYPRGEGMKLSELIQLAGGFRASAAGMITVAHARRSVDPKSPESLIKPPKMVDVGRNGMPAPDDDLVLTDGDVVTVPSVGGFKERVEVVYVKGAVSRPGPVVLRSNKMRLSEAVAEAGGLRPEGFAPGAEFSRRRDMLTTTGQQDLAALVSRLSDILNADTFKREQAKADVDRLQAIGSATTSSNVALIPGAASSAVTSPAAMELANQPPQGALVTPARNLTDEELTPHGSIAVNLPHALKTPGSDDDIILVDGDVITIPETPSTIQVVGAVVNGRGVVFKEGAPASYYIERVGGFTNDAATDRVVVIHYGGGIIPLNQVGKLMPGDVILVPTKVLAAKISNHRAEVDSFFRNLASTAITIGVLANLLR